MKHLYALLLLSLSRLTFRIGAFVIVGLVAIYFGLYLGVNAILDTPYYASYEINDEVICEVVRERRTFTAQCPDHEDQLVTTDAAAVEHFVQWHLELIMEESK